MLVSARATRRDSDGALLLLFTDVDDAAHARMLEALPCVEEVGRDDGPGAKSPRIVAAEITRS